MAGTNEFLPFAAANGANALTPTAYAALTSLVQDGFVSGLAQSSQINTVFRQCSLIAAMVAQLIVDSTGQNATDDGTIATLESNLARAMRGDISIGVDTGAANAYSMSLSPAPLALSPGMIVAIDSIVATNTGASTLNVNGMGALPIQYPGAIVLSGGELVSGYGAVLRLNHAGTAWVLLESTGASVAPTPAPGNNSTKIATTAFVQAGFAELNGNPGNVFQVGTATTSSEAVPLGQAQADFAALNGNAANVFNVANATTSTEAVNLSQSLAGASIYNVTSSRSLGTMYTNTSARPRVVYIYMASTATTFTAQLSIDGQNVYGASAYAADGPCGSSWIVPPGATYEASANLGTGSFSSWIEEY